MVALSMPNYLEDDIHIAYMEWVRLHSDLAKVTWHTPNQRNCSPQRGNKLRKMGVLSGVPDIFMAIPKGGYSGLFIEMKSPKGNLTPAQKMMLERLNNQGYKAISCRSVDEAITQTKNYLFMD